MKRIITLCLLSFCFALLSAQGVMLRITLKDGNIGTPDASGLYVIDADLLDNMLFIAKPIEGNPQHVKLLDSSNIEWSTINYGASTPEEVGQLIRWSTEDVVFNNWTSPDPDNRKWRMPTVDELVELIYECKWELTEDGKGYWVSNYNDKSKQIYLPCTTNYWSSTPDGDNKAEALFFSNGPQQVSTNHLGMLAIRPVWGDPAFSAKVSAEVASTDFYSATVKISVTECSDESKIAGYGISGDLSQESTTNTIQLSNLTPGSSYTIRGYLKAQNISRLYESDPITVSTPTKTLGVVSTATAESYELATIKMTIAANALETVSYVIEYGKESDTDYTNSKSGTVSLTTTSGQEIIESLEGLEAEQTYKYRVTVKYANPNYAETSFSDSFVTPAQSKYKIPKAVDLGLSVKWADMNLGAEVETDYGGYFGWGDPTGENRSTRSGFYAPGKSFTNIGGDAEYDIAAAQLKGYWRLPTCQEIEELALCNPQYVTKTTVKNGVAVSIEGWLMTGSTGNNIFIPCAGLRVGADESNMEDVGRYAYIWSDSVRTEGVFYTIGYVMDKSEVSKARGLSVRPVYDDGTGPKPTDPNIDLSNEIVEGSDQNDATGIIPQDGVDMGSGVKWSRWNFGVKNKTGEYGRYYAWGETEVKSDYSESNYIESLNGKAPSEFTNYSFDDEYDVVRKYWGDEWRMPTAGEIAVLINNCEVEWTQEEGSTIWGYKFTSKINGKSIFFPAGGTKVATMHTGIGETGRYWSNSVYTLGDANKTSGYATTMEFSSTSAPSNSGIWRYYGLLIRPVRNK